MVEAAPEAGMDEGMEEMEGMDAEADENAIDDEDEDADGEGEKNEYVKKEFVARPWESDSLANTIEQVEGFAIKNAR